MMKFLIFILLFPLIGLAEVPATNQELDELNERQEQLFWNEGSAVAVAAAASGTSYKINGGKEKLISRHQSSLRRTSELIQIKRDNHLSTKAVEAHRSNLESSIAKKKSHLKKVFMN